MVLDEDSQGSDQGWKVFKRKDTESPAKPQNVKVSGIADEFTDEPPNVETALEHAPAVKSAAQVSHHTVTDDNAPLNLETATARRLTWTPPSKPPGPIINLDSSASKDNHGSEIDEEPLPRFDKMLEAFRMQETSRKSTASESTDEETSLFRKRKLIECVNTKPIAETATTEPSPVKQKAPKKKPRTITALATAAYRMPSQPQPAEATEVNATTGTSITKDAESAATNAKGKKPARKRASKAKKKKTPPPKPILLSPNAALKQVANQDFVFGTSSQLVGEHSPTFLRDLAAAMKRSNQIDNVEIVTPLNSDAIELSETRKSLWDAAARDIDGDLFDVELQDIAEQSPELPAPADLDDPFGYVKGDTSMSADDSFMNLSDIIEPLTQTPKKPSTLAKGVLGDDFMGATMENPVEPSPVPSPSKATPKKSPKKAAAKPSYDLFTDAQLAREVSSYGFKEVKQRKARIALLERCWQSQVQRQAGDVRLASTLSPTKSIAASSKAPVTKSPPKTPRRAASSAASQSVLPTAPDSQEPPPSAQPVVTPKRPRGRPKKSDSITKSQSQAHVFKAPATPQQTQRLHNVVEIPDSDSDEGSILSASPSLSPEPTFSSPGEVDLSMSVDEDTEISFTAESGNGVEPAVFDYITKAVKSMPRTTDPANPSWHEKMLMYDTIIIEDLTVWLNSGHLTKAGYDDEVPTGEVKRWCESKSICCVWQTNLRGKERKRL